MSSPDPIAMFPVLGEQWSVPLALVAPHEAQAMRNHQQTVKRLAERGGLDPIEMLAVLNDVDFPWFKKHTAADVQAARDEIRRRVEVLRDEATNVR